ncbi:hypothetical protein K431DRAFT_304697 [Polychaeton citri CBS 116435]|uniref:Uncharacterized protein n=1 Tax=Polychaeton citri CBS 116435 TaxID=1314669 RepID=A0A9P4Q7U2_9PEZI|nr:hypothetical protein K431DRAFT_304697 [Polychaeton citri CBS 116435]
MADALDFMPLAMTQAAAYIAQRKSRCTVRDYLNKLQKCDQSGNSISDYDLGDLCRDKEASNSVMLTWQVSFEYVQRMWPSARDLLSLMSFFDRNGISEFVLLASHSRDDS